MFSLLYKTLEAERHQWPLLASHVETHVYVFPIVIDANLQFMQVSFCSLTENAVIPILTFLMFSSFFKDWYCCFILIIFLFFGVLFFFCRMALQSASNPTTPSAQVVGNAFVEQYYHILHTSPELVYRFYQDSSVLSRPDTNGMMTSVATMQVSC